MLTYLIIGINVVVSLIGFNALRDPERARQFLLIPNQVAERENYLGMVLSQFSHADMGHLLFNMITLYFFGPVVETILGFESLLAIYLVAAAASTAYVVYRHKDNPGYSALGASGAVSGVLFSAIVLYPAMNIYLFFVPIPIPSPIFAVGYILISMYLMKQHGGRISHEAHIAGALAGFLLTGFTAPLGFEPLVERLMNFF